MKCFGQVKLLQQKHGLNKLGSELEHAIQKLLVCLWECLWNSRISEWNKLPFVFRKNAHFSSAFGWVCFLSRPARRGGERKGATTGGANQPTRQKSRDAEAEQRASLDGYMVEALSGPGARCKLCNNSFHCRSGQEGEPLAGNGWPFCPQCRSQFHSKITPELN